MKNHLKYTKYAAVIAIVTLCMGLTIYSQNENIDVQFCDGKDIPITVLVVPEEV